MIHKWVWVVCCFQLEIASESKKLTSKRKPSVVMNL
jgi:hypothetical protein